MTEIEQKALALLNELSDYEVPDLDEAQYSTAIQALCRAIEQHEQFKREVSDAVEDYCGYVPPDCPSHPITRFILPKPVDPLVEAYQACFPEDTGIPSICAMLQAEITKRGGRIVWENEP